MPVPSLLSWSRQRSSQHQTALLLRLLDHGSNQSAHRSDHVHPTSQSVEVHDRADTTQKALVKVFGSVESSDCANIRDRSMLHCKRSDTCRQKGAVYRYIRSTPRGSRYSQTPSVPVHYSGSVPKKCTANRLFRSVPVHARPTKLITVLFIYGSISAV